MSYDGTPDSCLASLHLHASMIWIKDLTRTTRYPRLDTRPSDNCRKQDEGNGQVLHGSVRARLDARHRGRLGVVRPIVFGAR